MKDRKIRLKISKIMAIVIILVSCISNFNLYAEEGENSGETTDEGTFWEQAQNWYTPGSTSIYLDSSVVTDIGKIVEIIGTAVIAIATVVLGVKYVLGSVADKADVKESMITLLFACLFFFGWSSLRGIFIKNIGYDSNGAVTGISGATQLFIFANNNGGTLENAFASIFSVVIIIAKIIAVLVTIYMGVKYIFSGSEGKAKLKEKGIMYIIGILLIFTTLNILSFISDAINNAL